jgi:hypothetical protein
LKDLDQVAYEDYLMDAFAEGQAWLRSFELWTAADLKKPEPKAAADAKPDAGTASAPGAAAAAAPAPAAAAASGVDDLFSFFASPSAGDQKGSGSGGGSSGGGGGSQDYYEGLFLATLLNKLDNFYDNAFKTNLRLTSVLARLAYCPHPVLHLYLYEPALPVCKGVRLLLTLLSEVCL